MYKRQGDNKKHILPWERAEENNFSTLINKGYFVTQLKDQASGQNGIYLFGFTDNDYLIAMRAVSYTHLDVYKRQQFLRMQRSHGRRVLDI